ncbi:ribosome binding protein [Babesia ovata]|uniref:Ribosome binding protein n=1 Tax=Babesia ovata TaxID=189622 RepID=A0A2H6KFY9_9APIC|nr:ribosome binding protein [Babesia ovata]GBE61912.1 ribosome binding protein [Babesia ovata]
MEKHDIPLNTLKECLMFLQWLHKGGGKHRLQEVSQTLYDRIKTHFDSKFVSVENVEKGLRPFLSAVSKFYERLCYKAEAGKYVTKSAEDISNALLDCHPKFFAAMYFLQYCVNNTFGTLGGGGWEKNYPGWEEDWRTWYGTYPKSGGDLQKYLRATVGDEKYSKIPGLLPGGFSEGEVIYYTLGSGYYQGYNMAGNLEKIVSKGNYNYFRSVFVSSAVADTGAAIPNTANALSLVRTFCDIVGEADQKDSGAELKPKLEEGLKRLTTPKSICWKDLQSHCAQLRDKLSKLFNKSKRFDFTGQATGLANLAGTDLAGRTADWLRGNLTTVRGKLDKIDTSDSVVTLRQDQRGGYFTNNFFPFGFTFRDHMNMQEGEVKRLLEDWRTVIDDLKKKTGSDLERLREILSGENPIGCTKPPPPPPNVDASANQGKKAEGTSNQSRDVSSGPPTGKSDAPAPALGKDGGSGSVGSTGPVTPASSGSADASSNQGVQRQQVVTQTAPDPPPAISPPSAAGGDGPPDKSGPPDQGSLGGATPGQQPGTSQDPARTQTLSASGSGSGPTGAQGTGKVGSGGAGPPGGQISGNDVSSVTTTSVSPAAGGGGSNGGGGGGARGGEKKGGTTLSPEQQKRLNDYGAELQAKRKRDEGNMTSIIDKVNENLEKIQQNKIEGNVQTNVRKQLLASLQNQNIARSRGGRRLNWRQPYDPKIITRRTKDVDPFYSSALDGSEVWNKSSRDLYIEKRREALERYHEEEKTKREQEYKDRISRLQNRQEADTIRAITSREQHEQTVIDALQSLKHIKEEEEKLQPAFVGSAVSDSQNPVVSSFDGAAVPDISGASRQQQDVANINDAYAKLYVKQARNLQVPPPTIEVAYKPQESADNISDTYPTSLQNQMRYATPNVLFDIIRPPGPTYDDKDFQSRGQMASVPIGANPSYDALDDGLEITKVARYDNETRDEKGFRPKDLSFGVKQNDPHYSYGITPIKPKFFIDRADFEISQDLEDPKIDLHIDASKPIVQDPVDNPDEYLYANDDDVLINKLKNAESWHGEDEGFSVLPKSNFNLEFTPSFLKSDGDHDPGIPRDTPRKPYDQKIPVFPNVDMCQNPWYVPDASSTTVTPTPSPPPSSDHLPPPNTIREMLHWLIGLTQYEYVGMIKERVEDLLRELNEDASQLSDALEVTGDPTQLTASHISNTLTEACLYSANFLYRIKYKDISDDFKTFFEDKEKYAFYYSSNPACLLCQLRDYAYVCYHQLEFLKSQCNRGARHGGWQDYEYGSGLSSPKSPLQAFLTDASDSKFKTHPFDPRDICLKSRVKMGFKEEHLPKTQQTGNVILTILSPSCGGEDPLLTLCSYLTCLTSRTPRTTGELLSFFHHFGNELHDVSSDLSKLGSALSKPHRHCPDWDRLAADDLQAINGARGSALPNSIHNHDKDHPKTLSSLLGCDIDNANCPQHLSPITYRAYALYSTAFAHHYLSWAVYLPDRLWESLLKLQDDLNKLQCHDSKSKPLHQCDKALPLLYSHGFTPPEGTLQLRISCSKVIAKLEEVANGQPIASLMTAMDEFLHRIRAPFLYTVLALWLTATLYIAHSLLYRMDVLRIRSHLLTTRASHLIDVKALLAGSRRMLSLYKDVDYFDDDLHS